MRSAFHIKFSLLFIFGLSLSSYAQEDDSKFKIKPTLRKEYSKHFEFSPFKRGLDNRIIKNRLDSLSLKPRTNWTKIDSLRFAQTNILAKNYSLAQHYYTHLTIDPTEEYTHNIDWLCLSYLSKNYKKSILKIESDYPELKPKSELHYFKTIFNFQDSINDNSDWHKLNQSVFKFNLDSNLKITKQNKEEIITPLINASKALHYLVFYVNNNDQIISRAFRDLGAFLENNISLTQAYIAYNVGRNYNKKDNQLIADLKRIKAKLIKKNYSIPIFRKYFPKIKKGRFNYDILKEKIIKEQNDTIPKHVPNFKSENKSIDFPFSPDYIMPIGFLIIFLLLLFFLKTKKK